MAKNNRLASLVSGIRGDNRQEAAPTSQPTEQQLKENAPDITQNVAEELGLNPEQLETLNIERRKKVGRPRGAKSGTAKPREERATFIVDKDITRKLKYIALMDTKLYKKVIAEALSSYIEQWEKQNGTINLPNSK